MKNILILGGRYLPNASANMICVNNIISSIPFDEYDVHVICYDDFAEYDSTDSVAVHRIRRGLLQSILYYLENKNSSFWRLFKKLILVLAKLKQVIFIPVFPLTDPIFTLREYFVAKKLFKKYNFQKVISVYMPLSSLLVGHFLKNKNPEIQFYPYFLDALVGGNNPSYISRTRFDNKAYKWEKFLISNADKVIYMESAREYRSNTYKLSDLGKSVYLDIPMIKNRSSVAPVNRKGVTILYIGSIQLSMRSPEFFLRLFNKCQNPEWKLIFVGETECSLLNQYSKIDSRISVVGKVSYDEAQKYIYDADILLNIGNSNANLTPSKVFEYISFGKKIISTYRIDNDSCVPYLKKYPLSLLIDERSPIEDVINDLELFVDSGMNSVEYEEISKLFFNNTATAFLKEIDV